MTKPLYIIVAADQRLGIGKSGNLPWTIPADMKRFRELTTNTTDPAKQNAVILGRRTWESIPERFRPLPSRRNIVLSRGSAEFLGALHADSFARALDIADDDAVESIYVIGGNSVYVEALPQAHKIFMTHVMGDFECDVQFPSLTADFTTAEYSEVQCTDKGIQYKYVTYTRTIS